MITLRKAHDRGHRQIGWLESYHTFSFADYHDDAWMHFGPLRVINEDYIQPGQGFDTHAHRDMEILTYVVSGELQHRDSMGNGSIIKPGEIQRMSAGTGIQHSEFNHSSSTRLHLLQIWILPEVKGITPSYEQKKINKTGQPLILIASSHPTVDAVKIHQKMNLYVVFLQNGDSITQPLSYHSGWLQLIKGRIKVNHEILNPGDGLGVRDEKQVVIECVEPAEFLWFEIPKTDARRV